MTHHRYRAAKLALISTAFVSSTAAPGPSVHYAQDTGPELVGTGVLSTRDDDLNSAFTPDGRTVYWTKSAAENIGVILFSHWDGKRWETPQVAPFSGQYSDFDPFVSPDGARLFWISNRPVNGKRKDDYDIWMVERAGPGWGSPQHLEAPINTDAQEFYPTVTAKGTLYFSSTRPGGLGRGDIYRAVPVGSGYGAPESLGDSVNTANHDGDPYIAPDESFLVFASYGRPDGAGDGDLYVSHKRNGTWTKARHLGRGINTGGREYCPIVSPDGKWLYFTSMRGPLDTPPDRPITFPELKAKLGSLLNGWGNIYRISVSALVG